MLERLRREIPGYRHEAIDIRDRDKVLALIDELRPELIIHTAAQPSHDRAAAIPFLDFEVNAVGTLNLLEAVRRSCPESPFVHMSTNKVYGDRPNTIALAELETRWDYADPIYEHGIECVNRIPSIKASTRCFGASKVAAWMSWCRNMDAISNIPDLLPPWRLTFDPVRSTQASSCMRLPRSVRSDQVQCGRAGISKVYGYGKRAKQVRDNIHCEDVARFMFEFYKNPRIAEVYNLGGGKGPMPVPLWRHSASPSR